MGTGLMTVHMEGYGQKWDNTWGIQTSSDPNGPITEGDILDLQQDATGFLTNAGTNPANGGYGGASSIVVAILGFTRQITPDEVNITGFLVNDGATPDGDTGPFWSVPLLLPCLSETPSATTVAPLSIALLINRGTNDIGVKPGRLYMRAVLQDGEVYPGSNVGVTWTDGTAQTAATDRVTEAVTDSLLPSWYGSADGPPIFWLCIPHYGEPETEFAGQVLSGSSITSITVNKPVSRQMTRGRRRK